MIWLCLTVLFLVITVAVFFFSSRKSSAWYYCMMLTVIFAGVATIDLIYTIVMWIKHGLA